MVDAQTIGVLVTAASVTVAAIYYIFTLRINSRTQELALKAQQQNLETRQTQLLMGIFDMMMKRDIMDAYANLMNLEWVDYDDWTNKNKTGTTFLDASLIWRYMECVGFIVKSKLLDAEKYYGINGDTVIKVWDKFSGVIETQRRLYEMPDRFAGFEYLADEMKRIREQKGLKLEYTEAYKKAYNFPA